MGEIILLDCGESFRWIKRQSAPVATFVNALSVEASKLLKDAITATRRSERISYLLSWSDTSRSNGTRSSCDSRHTHTHAMHSRRRFRVSTKYKRIHFHNTTHNWQKKQTEPESRFQRKKKQFQRRKINIVKWCEVKTRKAIEWAAIRHLFYAICADCRWLSVECANQTFCCCSLGANSQNTDWDNMWYAQLATWSPLVQRVVV